MVDCTVYYQIEDKFVKLPASIESCDTSEELSEIQFTLLDEPVSTEHRETDRVSAVMEDLFMDIGDDEECRLLDVSVTACSCISYEQYNMGQQVNITLYNGD